MFVMFPPVTSGPIEGQGLAAGHQFGLEAKYKDAGRVWVDGTGLGKLARALGTSEVLAQAVDHPVLEELPHQRVALVTESQLPQRINVRNTFESLPGVPLPLALPCHPRLYIALSLVAETAW